MVESAPGTPVSALYRFAARQTAARLRTLESRIERCGEACEPEPVHQLRVAVRRTQSCLLAFEPLFPKRKNRKLRKNIKKLRSLAGEVRDCDIALELIEREAPGVAAVVALTERRHNTAAVLAAVLRKYPAQGMAKRWAKRLRLDKKKPRSRRASAPWKLSRSAAWNAPPPVNLRRALQGRASPPPKWRRRPWHRG